MHIDFVKPRADFGISGSGFELITSGVEVSDVATGPGSIGGGGISISAVQTLQVVVNPVGGIFFWYCIDFFPARTSHFN